MIDWLNAIDTDCFLWLNGCHSVYFDHFMWLVSSRASWALLLLALLLVLRQRGWRFALLVVACIALAVLLADQVSSGLIKHWVERPRPSHNPDMEGLVHLVRDYRGGPFGFVSSHAANAFAVTVLLGRMLANRLLNVLLLLWAALQCYSRIYLGVHYPGDILGGMLVGLMAATVVFALYGRTRARYLKRDDGFRPTDARPFVIAVVTSVLAVAAAAALMCFA